jgi:hypothetical protein
MADPTPASDDFANLPGPPLGLWRPLSGLGLRLQRVSLLGERSLSILDTNLKSPLGAVSDRNPDPIFEGFASPPAPPDLSRQGADIADMADTPETVLGETQAGTRVPRDQSSSSEVATPTTIADAPSQTPQPRSEPSPSGSPPPAGNNSPLRRSPRRPPRRDHPGTVTDAGALAARLPNANPTPPVQRQEVRGNPPPPNPPRLDRRPETSARPVQMPPRAQRVHPGTVGVPPAMAPPPLSPGTDGTAPPPSPGPESVEPESPVAGSELPSMTAPDATAPPPEVSSPGATAEPPAIQAAIEATTPAPAASPSSPDSTGTVPDSPTAATPAPTPAAEAAATSSPNGAKWGH